MNDKKKNPLEGIFAQVTDDNLLRENGLLYAENKQLQSNWNSLREWINIRLQAEILRTGMRNEELIVVLDKMNELEKRNEE